MVDTLRTRLAALAAAGGLTVAVAHAQPPAEVPPAPAPAPVEPAPLPVPEPRVIRWPGGCLVLNDAPAAGPEVVGRVPLAGRKAVNVVTGSGNGFGNTIVVDGGPGGLTVVRNARNGVGNRLVVNPADDLLDLDRELADLLDWVPPAARPAPVAPAVPKVYRGKANPFWTKKAFSDAHDCNLYWSPADKGWFRYSADDDSYRPVAGGPEAPK